MRLRRARYEDLSEQWLEELEAQHKSVETIRAYRSDLRLWHGSGLDPASYLLTLGAADAKPATINRRRAALRAYHDWLIGKGLIEANPLERTKSLKDPRRLQRTLTVDEVARLIDGAGQLGNRGDRPAAVVEQLGHAPIEFYRARLQAMIAVQVTAGLRVSELCRALADQASVEKRTIRVIRKGGNEQQLRFGMSAKRALEGWRAVRALYGSGPHDYLFCSAAGEPVHPKSYARQLHEACWYAGIEPVHPHTLRHTFATLAIESGIPVADVQQMLGHASVVTTMGYVNRHPDRGFDRYESHPLA